MRPAGLRIDRFSVRSPGREAGEERSAGEVSKRILALYVLAAIGLGAGLAGSWHLTNIIISLWPGLPRVTLTLTILFCGVWGARKVYKSLKEDWGDRET